MQKFTIFTIILTIIIIVVVSEIVVNEYLPSLDEDDSFSLVLPASLDLSDGIQTNVLGADFDLAHKNDYIKDNPVVDSELLVTEFATVPTVNSNTTGLSDFEDENFIPITANVYIRDEQIKSAGFAGSYLERETHNDYLFKTIYIGDIYDTEITKYMVRTDDSILTKIYVFKIGYKTDVDEIYKYLKERINNAMNMELNETNEYGYVSFYMNDPKRPDTSFLTVRIGGLLYSFSYPKEYHSQIKNLVKLIEWDLG